MLPKVIIKNICQLFHCAALTASEVKSALGGLNFGKMFLMICIDFFSNGLSCHDRTRQKCNNPSV